MMRTCASHKEGLSYRKADIAACAAYIEGAYKLHPLAPPLMQPAHGSPEK